MKKKEQKALAQKIAKYELIVQTSDDKKRIRDAQDKIMELSGRVETLDDIAAIDEMVQEILDKFLDKKSSIREEFNKLDISLGNNVDDIKSKQEGIYGKKL